MGKYDKDRYQKELAIRYCLARGFVPFMEVVVNNISDLSDSVEVITDIDVLGITSPADGALSRTIFDCKSNNKLSAINRAFWCAGLRDYTNCNDAFVILKNRAVYNHRISALNINVDLHDENSFIDLGKTFDPAFPKSNSYQSSVDRWNEVYEIYNQLRWSIPLFEISRNIAPLTKAPWSVFRRILAELRAARGEFDPSKNKHMALYLDVLCSVFVLWATIGRDLRRFYDPAMNKAAFEKSFKYYIWGGRDSYNIRQQIRDRAVEDAGASIEFPAWNDLLSLASILLGSPQSILGCAVMCRELSIRFACGADSDLDQSLISNFRNDNRLLQFIVGMADYGAKAAGLPRDMALKVQEAIAIKSSK